MISEKCLSGSSPCGPFIGPSGLLVKGVREGEGKRREDATYDRERGRVAPGSFTFFLRDPLPE